MKKNTVRFDEAAANAPRVSWAPKPKPVYNAIERDNTASMLFGIILGAAIMCGIYLLAAPKTYDNLDMNHDGKVTLTDLVIAKRAEIQIKARLLGEPDPFAVVAP